MLGRLARCEIHRSSPAPGRQLVVITGTLAFIGAGRVARELAAVPPGQSVELELHLDYLDHEEECIAANVEQQLANLRTYPSVRQALDEGRLELNGLYFDLAEARMYTVTGGVRSPVSAL